MKQSALTVIIPVSDEQAAPLGKLLTAVGKNFSNENRTWWQEPVIELTAMNSVAHWFLTPFSFSKGIHPIQDAYGLPKEPAAI